MFFYWYRERLTGHPVCAIAAELPFDYSRGKPRPVLASYKLTDEQATLSFAVLEQLFPLPQEFRQ